MTALPVLRGLPRDSGAVCTSCRHQRDGNICVATTARRVHPVTGRHQLEGAVYCDARNAAGECPLYRPTLVRLVVAWLDRYLTRTVIQPPAGDPVVEATDVEDSDVWPTSPYRVVAESDREPRSFGGRRYRR